MITSTIFNIFLKKMLSEGFNLSLKDTYKMCLLKRTYKAEEGGPSEADADYYTSISQAGYECLDKSDTPSYIKGGQYVQLVAGDKNLRDNTQDFYLKKRLVWNNVTLTGSNAVMYVLLYRESDGFPIAIYGLDEPLEIQDDTLILDWGKTPIITIDTVEPEKFKVDPYLSLNSVNSIENRVVTDAIGKFGVAFVDEMIKDGLDDVSEEEAIPDDLKDKMTRVSTIKEDYITSLFEGLN